MSFAKTVASGAPVGYPKTLLHSTTSHQYQPRGGTFDAHNKRMEAQSNQMYMNGRGHVKHYANNGGGRDSYIYGNDGGFTKQFQPVKWPGVGAIQSKPAYKKAPPNPVMHAKPIYYRANGGGRDSYIETTSGGQFNTLNHSYEYRDNFKKSLRSYERLPVKDRAQRPVFSAMHGQRLTNYNGRENQKIFGSPQTFYRGNSSRSNQISVERKANTNKKITNNIILGFEEEPVSRNGNVNKSQDIRPTNSVFEKQVNRTFVGKSTANPLSGNLSYAENPTQDLYHDSQQTFPRMFVNTQTRLSAYQGTLDARLSKPKHIRRRVIGNGYHAQSKEQKLRRYYLQSQERDTLDARHMKNVESALNLLDDNEITIDAKHEVNHTVV